MNLPGCKASYLSIKLLTMLASSNFTSSTPELPKANIDSFLAGLWLTLSYDELSIKFCAAAAPAWASVAKCRTPLPPANPS